MELLYRERFHLSDQEMQHESAEAVKWWIAVENSRGLQQRRAEEAAMAAQAAAQQNAYVVPVMPGDL